MFYWKNWYYKMKRKDKERIIGIKNSEYHKWWEKDNSDCEDVKKKLNKNDIK